MTEGARRQCRLLPSSRCSMQQAPVGKEPRVAGRDGPYPVLRAPAMPPQAFVLPFRPTGQPSVKVLKRGVKPRWIVPTVVRQPPPDDGGEHPC